MANDAFPSEITTTSTHIRGSTMTSDESRALVSRLLLTNSDVKRKTKCFIMKNAETNLYFPNVCS